MSLSTDPMNMMNYEIKNEWQLDDVQFTCGNKKKSRVWEYFGFRKVKGEDGGEGHVLKENVYCKLCYKAYKYTGGTTNLISHLQVHHEINVKDDQQSPMSMLQPRTTPGRMNQSSISSKRPNFIQPFTQDKADQIDQLLRELIIEDMNPISIVETNGFQQLMRVCEPKYQIPYFPTILPYLHTTLMEKLKQKLSSEPYSFCALALDEWSSKTHQFRTATLHAITKTWEKQTFVLETQILEDENKDDPGEISTQFETFQQEWGFSDPIIVGNATEYEKQAFSTLNWPHLPCIWHYVNAAVQFALEVDKVTEVITKVRKLVTSFFKRPSMRAALNYHQEQTLDLEFQHKSLTHDDVSNWTSTVDMLQSVSDQMPAIKSMIDETDFKLKGVMLNEDEISLVSEVLNFLWPFKEVIVHMCKDDITTLPALYPTVIKIKSHLDKVYVNQIIANMQKAAKLHFNDWYMDKDVLLISSFLHPRTKALNFVDDDTKNEIVDKIKSILRPMVKQLETESDKGMLKTILDNGANNGFENGDNGENSRESHSPPIAKKPRQMTDVMDWIDDVVVCGSDDPEGDPTTMTLEKEVKTYLNESPSKDDPLLWWKTHESIYPHLAIIAKKYLCIPASCVQYDSALGDKAKTKLKNRELLHPERADMMIFLSENHARNRKWTNTGAVNVFQQ